MNKSKERGANMRVLIVEDDATIAGALAEGLETIKIDAKIVTDFTDVLAEFQTYQPHLVLLDIYLPTFNGYYWCSQIRAISSVPIIFISSAADEMNQLMAIEMGGDDFVQKPIEMRLTLAKIQALLRRTYDFNQSTLHLKTFGPVELDTQKAELSYHEKRVTLTFTELQILILLFENGEHYSRREDILDFCWQNNQFIDDNTLAVNISRLRKKLRELDLDQLIETKKNYGYRLNGEGIM